METPMLTFDVTVASLERLSPLFTRITFEGASLVELHRCGELGPRDIRVKLLLAHDGSGPAPLVPDFTDSEGYAAWRALDPVERGVMRTYTVRGIHGPADAPLLDIDFVIHPGGPASTWAENAKPGDPMLIMGPNRASEWYGGIEWRPPTTEGTRVLLVGDETAAPAIGSILETLPSEYTGDVLIEVPSEQDFLTLATKADLDIRFLPRDDRPRGELLLGEVARVTDRHGPGSEVEDVDVDSELLWEVPERADSEFYAWVAGEASVVRSVRRHLVRDRGIDRRAVAFMGYWREGRSEPD
ncbi:MAG TPA: siderophore-interacting protein [Nocardioidaceae bacterium]|nr:siderophore-interacting protein [Nocardioidaceae bacterium]